MDFVKVTACDKKSFLITPTMYLKLAWINEQLFAKYYSNQKVFQSGKQLLISNNSTGRAERCGILIIFCIATEPTL